MPLSKKFLRWPSLLLPGLVALLTTVHWWLLPGGFPLFSRWSVESHLVIPFLTMAAWMTFLGNLLRNRAMQHAAYVIGGAFLGISFLHLYFFREFFPDPSWWPVGALVLLVSILSGACFLARYTPPPSETQRLAALFFLAVGCLGPPAILLATKAIPADTRPLMPVTTTVCASGSTVVSGPEGHNHDNPILANRISLEEHRVVIQLADGELVIDPVMHFFSQNESGLWGIWGHREAIRPHIGRFSEEPERLRFCWWGSRQADGRKTRLLTGEVNLQIDRVIPDTVTVHLRTYTRITEQINAHQAQCFALFFRAADKPLLRIGRREGTLIIPQRPGYPFGTPLTFMCTAGNAFRLLQAASGEKGPYQLIAVFPGTDPAIRIMTRERSAALFTLQGFFAQASRETSPTAGWGLPVNSIQFTAERDGHSRFPTGVAVTYSLAATGIGRGYHTVGTGPGTYCFTLTLQLFSSQEMSIQQ